jgi:formyltetrahydrofolate hydrolase
LSLEQGRVCPIGATAHYSTKELDEGPIIEQDAVRVTHHDRPVELERRDVDVARTVLARAVQWHCKDRVVRDVERTVVFRGALPTCEEARRLSFRETKTRSAT